LPFCMAQFCSEKGQLDMVSVELVEGTRTLCEAVAQKSIGWIGDEF
jgi:hypothetical protein